MYYWLLEIPTLSNMVFFKYFPTFVFKKFLLAYTFLVRVTKPLMRKSPQKGKVLFCILIRIPGLFFVLFHESPGEQRIF